jgi:hypothetical protein
MDGNNIGMVQRAGDECFKDEVLPGRIVICPFRLQHLDGDLPIYRRLSSGIDNPHTATA